MKPEVLEKLSKLDWGNLTKQLYAISIYWAKITFKGQWKRLPKGHTIDDIVQDAIRRGFSKDWERYDSVEFKKFLFGACRSIIYNLNRSSKIQKNEPLNDEIHDLPLFSQSETSVENNMIEEMDYENTISRIESKIGDDSTMRSVFDGIRKGLDPKGISEDTGMSVKKVYNVKKQLFRIIDNISNE